LIGRDIILGFAVGIRGVPRPAVGKPPGEDDLERIIVGIPLIRSVIDIPNARVGVDSGIPAVHSVACIAIVMGVGAVFGALNTMYSAIAERSREIATMRALGFAGSAVVFSFIVESPFIAFLGGVLGCLAVLPLNGFTTGTINWQTFSHLAFAFKITPGLFVSGIVFALLMGFIGGVPPALRAVRRPVAVALRGL
jgi:ABC-type antimicrobial peptide transport system permease subunit